jgi:hypothetical protein
MPQPLSQSHISIRLQSLLVLLPLHRGRILRHQRRPSRHPRNSCKATCATYGTHHLKAPRNRAVGNNTSAVSDTCLYTLVSEAPLSPRLVAFSRVAQPDPSNTPGYPWSPPQLGRGYPSDISNSSRKSEMHLVRLRQDKEDSLRNIICNKSMPTFFSATSLT